MSQKVNDNISLAGDELLKYQKKQGLSIAVSMISAGLIAVSITQKDAEPMMYVGGMGLFAGVVIKISSLTNLKRSSKHLINKNL